MELDSVSSIAYDRIWRKDMEVLCFRAKHSTMMNDAEKADKAKRMDIIARQAELSPWMSFIPLNLVCSCGFDFVDYPPAYEKLITGCPRCNRSYC